MLQEAIKRWFLGYKKYLVTYSKGFYNIPYLANSPETMVASMQKLPFVKHDKKLQLLQSNTPFLKGGFYYQKIEEGLFLLYSTVYYKANVAYNMIYDEQMPNDYYMISLNLTANRKTVYKLLDKRELSLPQYSWTFLKPRQIFGDVNTKGSDCRYISFYFSKQWLDANLMHHDVFVKNKLSDFVLSKNTFIMQPLAPKHINNEFSVFENLVRVDREKSKVDMLSLKSHTFNLFNTLFNLHLNEDFEENTEQIEKTDLITMRKVEKELMKSIDGKFPGIAVLAGCHDISESKLKKDFKRTFGQPVFQYFQQKQMQLAKELLSQDSNLYVKEIAHKLGYENVGKFSAAFKKHYGFLPSKAK
ncbi:MAG: helix-turn-helix transcriptional regulator [Bacteroidetes bacterium]|nr:helix-turn-helix transcriptional regulator [Bacteroidota bacterium]